MTKSYPIVPILRGRNFGYSIYVQFKDADVHADSQRIENLVPERSFRSICESFASMCKGKSSLIKAVIFGITVGITRILVAFLMDFMSKSTLTSGPFVAIYRGNLKIFEHWDSGWFIQIAQHGYFSIQSTAFYPGYPLLIRLAHVLVGANTSINTVAVLVDWSAFIASIIALYIATSLVTSEIGGAVVAVFYAFAPASVFSVSAYSESTTVLLCALSAILIVKKHPFAGAAIAGLASLTGSVGAVFGLSISLGYLLRERKFFRAVLIGLLSETGSFLYAGYLWSRFNNPLENLVAQKNWFRHAVVPFTGLYANIVNIVTGRIHFSVLPLPATNKNMVTAWVIDDLTALIVVFIVIAYLFFAIRERSLLGIPLEWVIFAVVSTIVINSTVITTFGTFVSTEALARLLGEVFAIYPIGYVVLKRLWILAGPIAIGLFSLCIMGQLLIVLNFWFT